MSRPHPARLAGAGLPSATPLPPPTPPVRLVPLSPFHRGRHRHLERLHSRPRSLRVSCSWQTVGSQQCLCVHSGPSRQGLGQLHCCGGMTGRVGREAGGDRGVGRRNLLRGQLLEEFSGPGLPDGGRGVCVYLPDGGRGVCVCVCVCASLMVAEGCVCISLMAAEGGVCVCASS